jgi:hypothetical protein
MTTIDNIELHDSNVIADESGCSELLLHLRPAYLHHWEYTSGGWHGVGRSQDATIRIAGGVVSPRVPASEILFLVDGALEYLDSEGNTLSHEDWRSIIQKHLEYCAREGIDSVDVTRPRTSSPDRIAAG